MLALIFIPAGMFQYWQGWAYVAVFIICSGAYTVYLAKRDPALLKRRTEAGISHEKEFTQKVVMALLFARLSFSSFCPRLMSAPAGR
jgi:protein-S-isoprenylcysteine O-methyltransferase Ste14